MDKRMDGKPAKVGILTFYYHNDNYGGLLQAAALVAALESMGAAAEQISFDRSTSARPFAETQPLTAGRLIRKAGRTVKKMTERGDAAAAAPLIHARVLAMRRYAETIPHTEVVGEAELPGMENRFDAFLCGSDQIWNPSYTRSAYFLDFVETKRRIAYAASIGRDTLTDAQRAFIAERVRGFSGISVREARGAELLAEMGVRGARVVVDPTLLLTREMWEERLRAVPISEKYLFTYFLGNDTVHRRAAERLAAERGWGLVTFPHILGKYRSEDKNFGGLPMYDCDPMQFLWLIRHAEAVLTDSFHACVFSILFEKQFAVFERNFADGRKKMGSRIQNLLAMFGLEESAVTPESVARDGIPRAAYGNAAKFEAMRDASLAYLEEMLRS